MSFSGGMIGVDSFVCLDLSSLSDMPASSNVVPQNGFVRRSAAMKIVKHHCRFLDGLPSPPLVTIPSWNCGEAHPNSADLGVCWNSLCIAFCVSQVARYGPHFWDDLESVETLLSSKHPSEVKMKPISPPDRSGVLLANWFPKPGKI